MQHLEQGLSNPVPGDLPSCRFSRMHTQPLQSTTAGDLVELLIGGIRCASLGLKGELGGQKNGRNTVGLPRLKEFHLGILFDFESCVSRAADMLCATGR